MVGATVFNALPLSYGGDIVGVMLCCDCMHAIVSVSTPFNVQLDAGTLGSPHPSFMRMGLRGT